MNEEILIEHPDNDPFARIPQKALDDPNLSLKATGLLVYLLGKPKTWRVVIKDIENRFTDGRDSIRTALKTLVRCGYAQKNRLRDSRGRMQGFQWKVCFYPKYATINGFSVNGESPPSKNKGTTSREKKNVIRLTEETALEPEEYHKSHCDCFQCRQERDF